MSSSSISRCCAGDSLSRAYKAARGFSLVELMTVLVIAAVLLVIAVPSYSVLSLRTKLKSYANELVASVYLARGEAIKRNAPMTMCISTNPTTPTLPTCTGGGDWNQGWIVVDQDGVVIKHQQPLPSGIKIFELSSLSTMTFQPSGILNTAATMTVCQDSPSVGIEEREVTFSTTGRQRVRPILNGETGFTDCSP
jgi:type IV fimbrial biogenesis protein FimT